MSTYEDFQALENSEKTILAHVEASRRLMGWTLDAGSIYKIVNTNYVISLVEDGTALSEQSAMPTGTSEFWHDYENGYLYVWTSDGAHPNGKFMALTFRNFFASSGGVHLPADLSSDRDMHYLPLIKSTSKFGVALDNKEFLGFALEGQGSITFLNDLDYWTDRYDKWFWPNQTIRIYSWNRALGANEAKIIFRGLTQSTKWNEKEIVFKLKDTLKALRQPVDLDDLVDASGAVVPPAKEIAKQRLVYGRAQGLVPSNIDSALPAGNLITGTVTVTSASATVTGSGTSFLNEIRQNDTVIFSNINDTEYTVLSVTNDTSLTLTENYSGATASGTPCKVKHAVPHRFQNRVHLIAGHALKEPATTVSGANKINVFVVADATDFFVGAEIKVGSEYSIIQKVSSNTIEVSPVLGSVPPVSTAVTLSSVWNVYLNEKKLDISRGDYSFSAANGTITLANDAEFNIAPIKYIAGTINFTNTSANITGTGTSFTKYLKPGDWVLNDNNGTWYEIKTITSDIAAVLISASGATGTGGRYKAPEICDGDKVILSLSAMGATQNGVKTGTFIGTAPLAVRDLLTRGGLSDDIVAARFNTANNVAPQIINLAIPENTYDKKPPKLRDVINLLNQSVFGSLYQNDSYKFEYQIIDPSRTSSFNLYIEPDILGLQIISDASRLIKTVVIEYLFKEFDYSSLEKSNSEYTHTSDIGNYLGKSSNQMRIKTVLSNAADAKVFAQRWAFIKEIASSVVRFKTGLQASKLHIHDRIKLSHSKLYYRYGTEDDKTKLAGITAIKRDLGSNEVEIDDIGNAFNRTAAITANDANVFDDASDQEKVLNGYITDNYGLLNNDEYTHQTNCIW